MTASNYATSTTISRRAILATRVGLDNYLTRIREQMRGELGRHLLRIIEEEYRTPAIIDLTWETHEAITDPDLYRIALVAHMQPAQMMEAVLLETPTWAYPRYYQDRPVPIEWQCSYCGQVNLVEKHLECRKCGGPRKPIR